MCVIVVAVVCTLFELMFQCFRFISTKQHENKGFITYSSADTHTHTNSLNDERIEICGEFEMSPFFHSLSLFSRLHNFHGHFSSHHAISLQIKPEHSNYHLAGKVCETRPTSNRTTTNETMKIDSHTASYNTAYDYFLSFATSN